MIPPVPADNPVTYATSSPMKSKLARAMRPIRAAKRAMTLGFLDWCRERVAKDLEATREHLAMAERDMWAGGADPVGLDSDVVELRDRHTALAEELGYIEALRDILLEEQSRCPCEE